MEAEVDNKGCLWIVVMIVVLTVFCAGTPDLLDAIISRVMRNCP